MNSTASFMCDSDYSPSGSTLIICEATGNWDQEPSTCGNKYIRNMFFFLFVSPSSNYQQKLQNETYEQHMIYFQKRIMKNADHSTVHDLKIESLEILEQ